MIKKKTISEVSGTLGVRMELILFVLEMEETLKSNDYKAGWDNMGIHELFRGIEDEFDGFKTEYILMNNSLDGVDRAPRLRKDAMDIANWCMFLCTNYSKREGYI